MKTLYLRTFIWNERTSNEISTNQFEGGIITYMKKYLSIFAVRKKNRPVIVFLRLVVRASTDDFTV